MHNDFSAQQTDLSERVRSRTVRFVYLYPVEGWSDWMAVVIEHPTGVVYGHF